MGKFTQSMIEELALQAARNREVMVEDPPEGDLLKDPARKPKKIEDKGWWPKSGKIAKEIFLCTKDYILVHGERFSGKTYACLHKIVKHLYENDDALAVVATLTRTAATEGGPWETLIKHILPEWADGIGLQGEGPGGEFLERRTEAQVRFVNVGTKNGKWSRVILVSLQHGEHVVNKIKNMSFSAFFFNELTQTDSPTYFTDAIQQLRRRGVNNKFYISDCNPSDQGEASWVYQKFFIPANQHDPAAFAVFHLPIAENVFDPEVPRYIARIMEEGKSDPTAIERKIHGKWIARPRGDGIFAGAWSRDRHLRGDLQEKTRIIPTKTWPFITISMDPGPANFAMSFQQMPPNAGGIRFVALFDELVHLGEKTGYRRIVAEMLRKCNFWCDLQKTNFRFQLISDAAAFSNVNNDGRFESRVIEELIEEELRLNRDRYPALGHIERMKMKACPKPPNSVVARTEMMRMKLDADEIVVSAICEKTVECFENLEVDDKRGPGYPLKNARGLVHVHDATSYGIFPYEIGALRQPVIEPETKSEESDFVAVG